MKKAFTLLELIFVIVTVAIVMSVVIIEPSESTEKLQKVTNKVTTTIQTHLNQSQQLKLEMTNLQEKMRILELENKALKQSINTLSDCSNNKAESTDISDEITVDVGTGY